MGYVPEESLVIAEDCIHQLYIVLPACHEKVLKIKANDTSTHLSIWPCSLFSGVVFREKIIVPVPPSYA